MTVVDASVLIDAFVGSEARGENARAELVDAPEFSAPAILGAEVASGLRRAVLRRELHPERANAALRRLERTGVEHFPFEPFVHRVWELRTTVTVYDAWYVALAEQLGTELVTTDARLVRAPGPRCPVRLPGEREGE